MTPELVRAEAGTVVVTPRALGRIVATAVEEVDGARLHRPRRGLRVEIARGHARVSLELSARRGAVLPELAASVQERVAAALATMLEVKVDAVDVSIEEVS